MFFCALDADRSGFLTEMDIALLSTESQAIKNRDARDKVHLGGGSGRNNVFHDKKTEGLKEFIRHVAQFIFSFLNISKYIAIFAEYFRILRCFAMQQMPWEEGQLQNI